MEVLRDQARCPSPPEGTVVTIGAYDGVHLGHRSVIRLVRQRAAERGLRSAVVTFDRHPASVVRPESAPRLLTDLEQKLELLAETGIDYCLVVAFDEARSRETAEDFVEEVLVECLNARDVVVGEDFHFGHRRAGNVPLLRRLGAELGFEVDGIELVGADNGPGGGDAPVSSTRIRRALVEGDLALANRLLGRDYEVRGVVALGDKRGRELGFPTANVSVPGDILLPTFYVEAHVSLLEAHLLDFDGDLYDEHVKVRFVARLRDEVRFDSVEALVEQIQSDVDQARELLRA
jgi:riboflavin kinase/FMN adenylyltransferase